MRQHSPAKLSCCSPACSALERLPRMLHGSATEGGRTPSGGAPALEAARAGLPVSWAAFRLQSLVVFSFPDSSLHNWTAGAAPQISFEQQRDHESTAAAVIRLSATPGRAREFARAGDS
eukprot:gene16173-biopygen10144